MSISKPAISLVHVAKHALGLSEEVYRQILRDEGGVESSKELTSHGLERVLRRFEALGFARPARRVPFGERIGMATDKQVTLIRTLWRDYSGSDDERRLNRWLFKYAHCSHLRFLTRMDASAAINGLKAMTQRSKAAQDTAGTAA